MKYLNKILIIPILLYCLTFGITSADDSDCGTFGLLSYDNGFEIVNNSRETKKNNYTNFLTIEEQKAIITKNDLNTAILNLKKYCCENERGGLEQKSNTCENYKIFFNSNTLDSPYLFDHIFDVVMRRLNGLSGSNDIYTETNMTLDDKGASRRTRISEQATSTGGSTPQSIINEYKKFRTQSSPELKYNISQNINTTFGNLSNQDFLNYVAGKGGNKESENIAKAMKNYSGWTLYDRYINACALSEYFYAVLNAGTNSNDKLKTINELSKGSCDKIVKKQIEGESSYTVLIEQRSSNLFLSNYIEGYKSYLYERQKRLQDLFKDSKNRRLDVIRAVPSLQRRCNKG